ncbi:WD40-repeat-containing domain protein [Syncephalis plumigaleata]|nr:WD40-repeat-containing domain protein [Syncephalis plumigaleata]
MAHEPSPSFVLRGHEAQITTLTFNPARTRLYSGLSNDCLFTHGRDGRACVWRLVDDISKEESSVTGRRTAPPQLIEQLAVNDTNFCKAALLCLPTVNIPDTTTPLWIMAGPAVSDPNKISVYSLLNGQTLCADVGMMDDHDKPTGVCMALAFLPIQKQALSSSNDTGNLLNHVHLLAGYEDGSVIAWSWTSTTTGSTAAHIVWRITTHREPIMSLGIDMNLNIVYTGSAGEQIGRIKLILSDTSYSIDETSSFPSMNIDKATGIADIVCQSECNLIAFATWDGIVYLYNSNDMTTSPVQLHYHRGSVSALAVTTPATLSDDNNQDTTTSLSVQHQPRSRLLQRSIMRQQTNQLMLASGGRDGRIALWPLHSS